MQEHATRRTDKQCLIAEQESAMLIFSFTNIYQFNLSR